MNVGILGAGNIAATMAKTLNRMQEARFYAIASRTQARADDFARQYGAVRAYGSYEAMLADPNVDLVYIATPHALHYQQGLQCIAHGKPVLCEKAFTANAPQAKALVRSAAEHRVFITEAIWTRYMPSRALIAEVVASGELGEIVSVSANLGYPVGSRERLCSPALAGGALLDMGVYPLNFICMTLGSDIADIRSACIKNEYGVDAQEAVILTYRDNRQATFHASMLTATDQLGVIYGTEGYLEAEAINNIQRITVYDPKRRPVRTIPVPPQLTGYEYEILACRDALQEGRLSCPEMPHEETIRMMELMDTLRGQWGVRFPFEIPGGL